MPAPIGHSVLHPVDGERHKTQPPFPSPPILLVPPWDCSSWPKTPKKKERPKLDFSPPAAAPAFVEAML